MKTITSLLLLLAGFAGLYADIMLEHRTPAAITADPLELELNVLTGWDTTSSAVLYWRAPGDNTYTAIDMASGGLRTQAYIATIEPQLLPNGVEYYFELTLKNGSTKTLPTDAAQLNPYRLLAARSSDKNPGFVLLSPDSNSVSDSQDLIFAVSWWGIQDQIDPATVSLTVNGKDVTAAATITANAAVYRMEQPAAGNYTFGINAQVNGGVKVQSPVWRVNYRTQPTFMETWNLSGTASVETYYEDTTADNSYNDDSNGEARWRLNLRGRRNKVGFSGNLYMTSRENADTQWMNRYSLKMWMPLLDLYLGDYSPDLGYFTLRGNNVRGAYTKIGVSWLNLQAVWGARKRAIDGQIATDGTVLKDGEFARNTVAARIQVGKPEVVSWGLSFSKTKDDLESLDEKYWEDTNPADSTTSYSLLRAQDNVVIGTDLTASFWRRRIKTGLEAAMSFYNSDINNGVLSEEQLEDDWGIDTGEMPFLPEDVEDLIVINQNFEPFTPGLSNLALRWFANLDLPGNFLSLSYTQVGSSFTSLGSSYLSQDTATLSVSDNMWLLNNQLSLGLGVNYITDNISDQKSSTTTTLSWWLQTYYQPRHLPTWFKAGVSTSNLTNDAEDAWGVDQKSSDYTFGMGYNLEQFDFASTSLSVNYTLNSATDDQNNSYDYSKNLVSVSAYSRYNALPLASLLRYTFSVSNNDDGTTDLGTTYNAVLVRGEYNLLDDTLTPWGGVEFSNFGGDTDSQTISSLRGGASWDVFKATSLSTALSYKMFANSDTEDTDYNRFNLEFKVSQRF